jgi:hypothetical protein
MRDEVVIKSGETVRFPVDVNHPFAKFQRLAQPAQIANLADLAIVRRVSTTLSDGRTSEGVVKSILDSAGVDTILDVSLPGSRSTSTCTA